MTQGFPLITKTAFSIMMSLISVSVLADTMDAAYSQGQAFANSVQSQTQHDASNPSYNTIPNYQGTNVPQTGYSGDLTEQARNAILHGQMPVASALSPSQFNQPSQEQQASINKIANQANAIQSQASTAGSNLYCANGDCVDKTYQPEDKETFGTNASAITAIVYAGQEYHSGTTPYMSENKFFSNYLLSQVKTFKGGNLQCRDMGFINGGLYDNCCSDEGWGQWIGLAGCNNEEKTLGQDKENDLCVYVGEYCSDKTLGLCNEHKKTYCCFQTVLAKVIQEQGRPQLGWNFGKADSPNCQGFSPQQLQRIDFSRIDFSEFYQTLESELHIPSSSEVQQELQHDMQEMFHNGNPT